MIDGDVEKFNFAAYYIKDKQVVAAAGMARGADLIAINQAMRMNIHCTLDDFNGSKLDIERLRARIAEKRPKCYCQRAQNLQN